LSTALDRLRHLADRLSGYEVARKENMEALVALYDRLGVAEKVPEFSELFHFKAINLSGVTLTAEALGSVKAGKYVPTIGIRSDEEGASKTRNISLGYFGRADKIDDGLKEAIVTFILRWRFEKSFRTLDHYHGLINALGEHESV
jgi:hypothetical protein